MLIDTHCHLSVDEYDNLDDVIKQMKDGVIIVSGVNTKTNKEVLELCKKYPNVYGTLGIHPEEVENTTDEDFLFIETHLQDKKIVGIGEIGLDYYWVKDNKEIQQEIFIRQLRLADKHKKSVVVHSRDAIRDTYEILKKEKLSVPIDIHCYSGSLEMAKEFAKLGCRFGIGGVVTFKNSCKLKEVVENIDLEYFLLETDSPYLAPVPVRGSQNVPYYAYYVAEKISEIKDVSVDEVLRVTAMNAIRQFDLPIKL